MANGLGGHALGQDSVFDIGKGPTVIEYREQHCDEELAEADRSSAA